MPYFPPATSVPDASETVKGVVELATSAETTTGSDTARATTPAGVKAVTDALSAAKVSGLNGVTALWAGTQTDYDLLTPSSTTVYIITGP